VFLFVKFSHFYFVITGAALQGEQHKIKYQFEIPRLLILKRYSSNYSLIIAVTFSLLKSVLDILDPNFVLKNMFCFPRSSPLPIKTFKQKNDNLSSSLPIG